MPTASTVASVVVALAAIAVVVRWPRPRADRRVLERRAHGLEALGAVVTRSASARHATVEHHINQLPTTPALHSTAITVLGPTDAAVNSEGLRHAPGHGTPGRQAPDARRSDRRLKREPRSHPSAPLPQRETTDHPHRTAPTRVVQLTVDDLPPDDDLSETVNGLTGAAETPPHTAAMGAPERAAAASTSPDGVAPNGRAIPVSVSPERGRHPLAARRPAARRLAVAGAAVLMVLGGTILTVTRSDTGLLETIPTERAEAMPSPPPPATDTTLPPPLTPSASSGDTVAFAVASPFTIDLAAGDTTWVRVQASSGEVLYEGTLAPGDTTTVPTAGPVRLRVGNPTGLLVAADGRLLDHPRPSGQPLTLALG